MCCHMLLDSTLPTVPKVLTGTHWNKMGNILSNYHLKLSSEKNRILSLECKIDGLRLEEWRDVLYPRVIYFDSPLNHRVHSMSKLILGTRGIHHSSGSEVLCMMHHVACHWISFGKTLARHKICVWTGKFQGIFLLFTWEALYFIFGSQIIETKNSLLGKLFRVC